MSTKVSLLWFDTEDGGSVHIYQEAGTDEVWMERVSKLCSVEEWKAGTKQQLPPREYND